MIIPDIHTIDHFIHNYGSIALFFLLAIGIIGLPIPDETLLVLSGAAVANQQLSLPAVIIATICGSMIGISVSYLIGYSAGYKVVHRYGRWLGLSEKKLDNAHAWFEKFGTWLLVIGYFIPGVRHFTGLIAGITRLTFWRFALFAYTGAVLWSITFLTIGYFFYHEWQQFNLFHSV